jgi:DNA-binding CsgD family transcriptional regulator
MLTNYTPKKTWKISSDANLVFSEQHIQRLLGFLSRLMNTSVYMIDCREQKLYVGNTPKPTISGYPKEFIRKESLRIYDKILCEGEKQRLDEISQEAFNIFHKYDNLEVREQLEFTYELKGKTITEREVSYCYRLTPFRLDGNGNLWLALCVVSTQPCITLRNTKASIGSFATGERFDYVDGKFAVSKLKSLLQDEVAILGYLAEGYLVKQITEELGIPQRTIERKLTDIYSKLKVRTQAAAVFRAKDMGLI